VSESQDDQLGEPKKVGAPQDLDKEARQTRMLIDALEKALAEFKEDLKDFRTEARNDIRLLLRGLAGSFIVLAGMIVAAYLLLSNDTKTVRDRMDDRLAALGVSVARIEQKLDDLIARVPPVQSPPPHR
jgi:hypothetical protein